MGVSETYICAMCKETYKKGWSDEEAIAELGNEFPDFTPPDCDIVCDDCYRKVMGKC